jgi:UDP-glucuronate 4-epimerase
MIFVTGAAGFIGFHTSLALLERGETVIGIDNLNDYYDVRLKEARLAILKENPAFHFHRADIADRSAMESIFAEHPKVDRMVHLAAQAGVRYSIENPFAYVESNVVGHLVLLEECRKRVGFRHFVYASSSSVYGGNREIPFSVKHPVDRPLAMYAATKRAGELMSRVYAHLYGLPSTGLRFFTVYGPWGRPDMAAYLFADAIVAGRPITVFNHGDMHRDFTYIDDIVAGVLAALDTPPAWDDHRDGDPVPHRVFNLGNSRSEKLLDYIAEIERALGLTAEKILAPMADGDVPQTSADVELSRKILGFDPKVPITVGIPRFIEWFREYHQV